MTAFSARASRALALAGVLLLGAGCGGGEGGGPPAPGHDAPAYGAETLEGAPVRLEELQGDPVLLNFWATWCTPCRQETPFLQSLHEEYRDRGLQVVGVSMDSPGAAGEIRSFVERYGVTYTILHDPSGRGMDVFSVMGLPATYVLDAGGTVRFARIGPVSEEDREFRDALAEVTGP